MQIATIESPLQFNRYAPVVIRGDLFYTVGTDNDGVPSLIRYRIARSLQARQALQRE